MTANNQNDFEAIISGFGDLTPPVLPVSCDNPILSGTFALWQDLPEVGPTELDRTDFIVHTGIGNMLLRGVAMCGPYLIVETKPTTKITAQLPDYHLLLGSVYVDNGAPEYDAVSSIINNTIGSAGVAAYDDQVYTFSRTKFMRDGWPVWQKAYTLDELRHVNLRRQLSKNGQPGQMVSVKLGAKKRTTPLFISNLLILGEKTNQLSVNMDGSYETVLSYIDS